MFVIDFFGIYEKCFIFVIKLGNKNPDLWRIKTEVVKENRVALRSLGVSIGLGDVYEHVGV